ncbi:hypothetical protein CDAR_256441 [Caerostris darwini]|uniref:Uncharacterized protein n=1 Tax=Caerostris darwini TaxID=1538125 RepID=A0AAV4SG06_9ARAC|nr:hypothetical protein CDAR_256441 [Caerostris darwini]
MENIENKNIARGYYLIIVVLKCQRCDVTQFQREEDLFDAGAGFLSDQFSKFFRSERTNVAPNSQKNTCGPPLVNLEEGQCRGWMGLEVHP